MSSLPVPRQPLVHEKAQLMSSSEIERTLVRVAHEITEKTGGTDNVTVVLANYHIPNPRDDS